MVLHGISGLSDLCYPVGVGMRGITIKLPEAVARQLKDQARQSGRSVAALIRERIEAPPRDGESVYAVSADLAGSLAGRRLPATNARSRFRRA
jgi:hypothetical protein